MSQPTTPKKEPKVSKQSTEKKVADKEKPKSTDTTSKEAQIQKSTPTNKSASQTSISHFSSVSTPEYREGWNRIFGNKENSNEIKSKDQSIKPMLGKLTISSTDIDKETRTILLKLFKKSAFKQGIDASLVEDLMTGAYTLDCLNKTK